MPCPVEEIIIKSKCGKQFTLITSIFGDRSRFKKISMIGKKDCNELIQTNNINNIF
jgi:hypothetical protein